jgi:hypothetical protein
MTNVNPILIMGKVEAVARTLCEAAGRENSKLGCNVCEDGTCTMWKQFRDEARAVIRLLKQRGEFI